MAPEETNTAVLDTPNDASDTQDGGKGKEATTPREDAVLKDLKESNKAADEGGDGGEGDKSKKAEEPGIEDAGDDADPQVKRMRDDYLTKSQKLEAEKQALKEEREELEAQKAELAKQAQKPALAKDADDKGDKGKKASEFFEGFHNPDPTTISGEYEGEQELHKAILSTAKHSTALDERVAKIEAALEKLPELESTVNRVSEAELAVAAQHVRSCVDDAAASASKTLGITVSPEQIYDACDKFATTLFDPDKEEFTAEIALEAFDIAYKRSQRALNAAKSSTNGKAATNGAATQKKQPPDMGGESLQGSDKDPVDREEKVIRDLQRARARRGET